MRVADLLTGFGIGGLVVILFSVSVESMRQSQARAYCEALHYPKSLATSNWSVIVCQTETSSVSKVFQRK